MTVALALRPSVAAGDVSTVRFTLPGDGFAVYATDVSVGGQTTPAVVTTTVGLQDALLDLYAEAMGIVGGDSCHEHAGLLPEAQTKSGGSHVIFVHGWDPFWVTCAGLRRLKPETAGSVVLGHIEARLSDVTAWTFTYPTFRPIAEAAALLADEIRSFPPDARIILVGHSMGGLVARGATHEAGVADRVIGAITLGTPHEGAAAALPSFWDGSLEHLALEYPVVWGIYRSTFGQFVFGATPFFLGTEGARDLRPGAPGYAATLPKDGPVPLFTFGGFLTTSEDVGTETPRCADERARCLIYLAGWLGYGEQGEASDGIVALSSARAEDAGAHVQPAYGSGYDHDELADGAFTQAGPPCAQGRPCDDPVLERVAELVDSLITQPLPGTARIYASSGRLGLLASGPSDLWIVPPYALSSDSLVARLRTTSGEMPVITDLARAANGQYWAMSFDDLYRLDTSSGILTYAGTLPSALSDANSMSFDAVGNMYVATINGIVARINLSAMQPDWIGSYGNSFIASGDLAFSADGRLFAAARDSKGDDYLVTVDLTSGTATPVSDRPVGWGNVWGLTFVDGVLYGLTSSTGSKPGTLLQIDHASGEGSWIRNLAFDAFGAASRVR
jgi:pimeloyl-ACP methyl ester carboxylesterase